MQKKQKVRKTYRKRYRERQKQRERERFTQSTSAYSDMKKNRRTNNAKENQSFGGANVSDFKKR